MEVINESFDFDVLNYLNSPEDNLSICEEFDFDLDMMLGCDECSSSQQGDNSTESTGNVTPNHNPQLTNYQEDDQTFGLFNQKYHTSRRLVLPVRKISDNLNNEILMKSNALVIDMEDKSTESVKSGRNSDHSKCVNLPAIDVLNARLSSFKTTKTQSKEDTELEEFAHSKGGHLLPKLAQDEDLKPHAQSKSTQTSVPIHHVRMNWNSFCLMKTLCRDGSENYICHNGNVLLPKVVRLSRASGRSQMKAFKKRKLQTVVTNCLNRVSPVETGAKVMNESKDDSDNVPLTGGEGIYRYQQRCYLEKIVAPSIHSVREDDSKRDSSTVFSTRSAVRLKGMSEKCIQDETVFKRKMDNYPPFKVRYLESLKDKLNRINSLPNPTKEFDMPTNDFVSTSEKIVLKEFFQSPHSTQKYVQIRNHILRLWNKQKPRRLIKTRIREGLQGPCDVNSIGLVYRYLERVGAINFEESGEDGEMSLQGC